MELERTEFVKVGAQHAPLRRVVEAAEIDTVVDTRLVVDSPTTSPSKAHENNVIGTMNILAACSAPSSPVRKVVFKSSTHFYGCEQDDPAFFDQTMGRPHQPPTPIERDIVEAEASMARVRRTQARGIGVGPALHQRAGAQRPHLARRPAVAPGGAAHPRVRPPLPVRARGRRCARPGACGGPRRARRVQRGRRRRARSGARWPASWASPMRPSCLPGARVWRPRSPSRRPRFRPRCSPSCAWARGRQPSFQGRRLSLPAHQPRDRAAARRAPPAPSGAARSPGALPLRARGGGVPALEPSRPRRPGEGRTALVPPVPPDADPAGRRRAPCRRRRGGRDRGAVPGRGGRGDGERRADEAAERAVARAKKAERRGGRGARHRAGERRARALEAAERAEAAAERPGPGPVPEPAPEPKPGPPEEPRPEPQPAGTPSATGVLAATTTTTWRPTRWSRCWPRSSAPTSSSCANTSANTPTARR